MTAKTAELTVKMIECNKYTIKGKFENFIKFKNKRLIVKNMFSNRSEKWHNGLGTCLTFG